MRFDEEYSMELESLMTNIVYVTRLEGVYQARMITLHSTSSRTGNITLTW